MEVESWLSPTVPKPHTLLQQLFTFYQSYYICPLPSFFFHGSILEQIQDNNIIFTIQQNYRWFFYIK